MSRFWPILQLPLSLFLFYQFYTTHGDVGTAAQYSPPYTPTECYGSDPSQFPSNNYFAAAGEGIWDNGAACGRQYLVKCINAPEPYACVDDEQNNTIQITIVHYAPTTYSAPSILATMVLSETALGAIASSSAEWINIEFQQV